MPKPDDRRTAQSLLKCIVKLARRSRRLLASLDKLQHLHELDRERLKYNRVLLEHTLARTQLDLAEVMQERALAACNRLDKELRKLEKSSQ